MLPNIAEIVIIFLVVAIVFGYSILGKLSASAAQLKHSFKEGIEDDPIDITPETGKDYKPGTRPQSVDDAEIEES